MNSPERTGETLRQSQRGTRRSVPIGGAYECSSDRCSTSMRFDTTESVLGEISKEIQPTRTALLAQVTEQSPEVIDAAMARLGGEVLRRPAVDVEEMKPKLHRSKAGASA
jgi:hypothetical protein